MDHYTLENMVKEQILDRGIKDERTIEAFHTVDRKLFVPDDLAAHAYEDRPLPIGYKQTISQPYIVAFMIAKAELTPSCKVLEIGTGCGYQAAILSKLCKDVYSIERVEPLGYEAVDRLKKLGYSNVHVRIGDGYKGWSSHAPFDAIIVTAAPEEVPSNLLNQLKLGGRMIVPVGRYMQTLVRVTKHEDGFTEEDLQPVSFVPMVHSEE